MLEAERHFPGHRAMPGTRVACSETGRRVGQYHQRAVLSDHDVELIRDLREEYGLSFGEIAEKFEVAKSTVADICYYRRRNTLAVTWRTA
jgi:predicted transcriptional regulator